MSTPGFHALRRRYAKAQIVALVPAGLAPILEGSRDLDAVWSLSPRGSAGMRADARRIRAEGFDLGIVIPESISSALLMRMGGVAGVTGYARDGLRRRLLHREVSSPPEWGRRRWVSKERFVLGLMGAVGAPSDDTTLRLEVTAEEEARLGRTLQERGIPWADLEARPPVVIAPGASFGESKCWPVASFAALADRLADRGERLLLIGTRAERNRLEAVREAMVAPIVDLPGALDLGALKALLRRARLLIANDAGARHVAAGLGLPSVIFFGPTSVEKTPENLRMIEILETEHDCRPCYRRECPLDHRCLISIGVPEALAAVDRALASGHRARDPRLASGRDGGEPIRFESGVSR